MNEVTTLAVGKMEPLLITRPSLQVHIAKAYDIRKWLAPGFFRLAQRTRPLDKWDVRLVGLQDLCPAKEDRAMRDMCGDTFRWLWSGRDWSCNSYQWF